MSAELSTPPRVCPLETRDLVARIVTFIELFADVPFYTYQSLFARRIIESTLEGDGATITGLWARQCGKTECIANTCIGMALILPLLANEFPDDNRLSPFLKGFKTGIYAPIQEQAQIAFSRMRAITGTKNGMEVMDDIQVGIVTNRSDTLEFSNGSIVLARSASPDTQIEGKTFHLVFLEEAQRLLRTKVEKEIRPMLTSTNGSMVKIGTAWESRGGFHLSIQHNVDSHAKGGKRDHFQFDYTIVIAEKRRAYERDRKIAHLNYEKVMAKERAAAGGEDSPEFKMNYKCLWQESRVIAVRSAIFREAALDGEGGRGVLERGPQRHGTQVAGLDIGKVNDSTVLTVMNVDYGNPIINPFRTSDSDEEKQFYYRKTILDWVEMQGSFEGDTGQYRTLVEYLLRTSVQVLVIDATAIGDPVYERIEAMIGGNITCVPFKFSAMTKSNLYKYYLQELHSGRIRYAAGPHTRQDYEYGKFQGEHLDLDKEEWGGYAICKAPEGGHDDYPDSAALACWAEKIAEEVIMPEISVTSASKDGGESRRGSGSFMGQQTVGQGSNGMLDQPSGGGRSGRYGRRR